MTVRLAAAFRGACGLVAAVLLVAMGAGCRGTVGQGPPGYLRVAIANGPTNLDPRVGIDEASQRVHRASARCSGSTSGWMSWATSPPASPCRTIGPIW